MKTRIHLFLLFCFTFSLDSSGQGFDQRQRGKLISEQFIGSIPFPEINNHFPEAKELEGDISSIPKYDIDFYRIVYTSIFMDTIIELSGLIIVPTAKEEVDILQYHHGTMLPYPLPNGEGSLDVPSLYDCKPGKDYKAQYETRLFGSYLASYGYLVSMPDYAGYAVSNQFEHPYSVNHTLANQSVDMILAVKEFCKRKNISSTDKLYLSGWSEGGAVCVAAQKLIESAYTGELSVTANAPLAGFYNTPFYVKRIMKRFPSIKQDLDGGLDVLIWALYAVNTYSQGRPIPNDNIFKYSVTNQLDVLKNRPNSIPSELFKEMSKDSLQQLIAKFEQHALVKNWRPVAPIYFHHGTDDDIVYYDYNVKVAIRNLKKNGGKCELRKYKKHDHYTLAHVYLLNMIADFNKYQK